MRVCGNQDCVTLLQRVSLQASKVEEQEGVSRTRRSSISAPPVTLPSTDAREIQTAGQSLFSLLSSLTNSVPQTVPGVCQDPLC